MIGYVSRWERVRVLSHVLVDPRGHLQISSGDSSSSRRIGSMEQQQQQHATPTRDIDMIHMGVVDIDTRSRHVT